jgi:hypothetical protein
MLVIFETHSIPTFFGPIKKFQQLYAIYEKHLHSAYKKSAIIAKEHKLHLKF